jgi:hypothetical protein
MHATQNIKAYLLTCNALYKQQQSSRVDDDLAALKGMISGSSSKPKVLEAEIKKDPKVEDELRK